MRHFKLHFLPSSQIWKTKVQRAKEPYSIARQEKVFLDKKIYHGEIKPQNRIVEMYHAGTPSRVKDHI